MYRSMSERSSALPTEAEPPIAIDIT